MNTHTHTRADLIFPLRGVGGVGWGGWDGEDSETWFEFRWAACVRERARFIKSPKEWRFCIRMIYGCGILRSLSRAPNVIMLRRDHSPVHVNK